MARKPKILALSGSIRTGSLNTCLIEFASRTLVVAGAEVTIVDLRNFPMPIYDGDLERDHGVPESVIKLKALLDSHDALVISSPEYNGFFSPLLKNTIDWLSRPHGGRSGRALFEGKIGFLLSASPGALGGMRGLVHVRQLLTNLGVWVMPNQLTLAKADAAFDSEGKLIDPDTASTLDSLSKEFVLTVQARIGDSGTEV